MMMVYVVAAAAMFWLGMVVATLGGLIFCSSRGAARWIKSGWDDRAILVVGGPPTVGSRWRGLRQSADGRSRPSLVNAETSRRAGR